MKLFKNTVLIVVSVLFVLFLSIVILLKHSGGDPRFIGLNKFYFPPNYNTTDNFLEKHCNKLTLVVEKLLAMDYESISIQIGYANNQSDYKMRIKQENSTYESIPISDELISLLDTLHTIGVQYVSRSRNVLDFTIWSNMNESRGIKFAVDGTVPTGEQLIEVKELSKERWYYYVHNYEKAIAQHPEKFIP